MPDFNSRFNLNSSRAIITGGAGLLGMQHAAALLELGASVVMTDLNETALTSAVAQLRIDFPAGDISAQAMDVTDPQSIERVSQLYHSQNKPVSILINNAAIDPKVDASRGLIESSRLENFPLEQWNLQVAVGLTGAFLCAQVFGTQMAKTGKGGVILNIASDLSVFSPDQRIYRKNDVAEAQQPVKPVTYSVIKTGLIGLTRYLATYWAEQGVRCNALSPGGVFTGQDEAFVQKLTQLIPMGRMADKDEYRAAVQFLCSDASRYMNGQNIVMDGGRSVW